MRLETHSTLILALIVLMTSSVVAQNKNQEKAAQPSPRFKKWDRNNDGRLTKNELPAALQRNFWRVDLNGDGSISPEEDAKVMGGGKRQAQAAGKVERDVNYAGDNNPKHTLDIYHPASKSDQLRPAIVFIHGGGWRQGDKRSGKNHLGRFMKTNQFVGFSVGYRLSNEAQWPAQIHDCKAAIRWIKGNSKRLGVDPERIAVWGTSAGGHLVLMLGLTGDAEASLEGKLGQHTKETSSVNCVVNWFGPTDLLRMNDFPGKIDHDAAKSPESLLIGQPIQEAKKKTQNASPLYHVTKNDAPVLTFHGAKDELVPIDQARRLDEALDKLGVESSWITVTNAGHGRFPIEKTDKLMMQFFKRHLLNEPKTPLVPEDSISN